jgi:hypothetical protein
MMDKITIISYKIRQAVEKMVRDEKKQRILADAQEPWKDQIPNRIGAAAMIREDRDARKGTSGLRQP